MFCNKCGTELQEDAAVCPKCGCSTQNRQKAQPAAVDNSKYEESKTGMGVVAGLFLGRIGLRMGRLVYPEGTESRKTFDKACGVTCVVQTVLSIIIIVLLIVVPLAMYN